MIENPLFRPKPDRLTAFLNAFGLTAAIVDPEIAFPEANLFIVTPKSPEHAERVVFFARRSRLSEADPAIAAIVEFGGSANPLLNALPDRVVFELRSEPAMRAAAEIFLAEACDPRCGAQIALDRLAEVMVLMALRRAIAVGAAGPGLIAGLGHPELHRPIIAMHDAPKRAWTVDDLARAAGMSRSHFQQRFRTVVGTTPLAYLTSWRLTVGRRQLARGQSVKDVAREVGFGSAAAFSRAFSRAFGHPPTQVPQPQTFDDSPRDEGWHHRIASLKPS
jgi:AraC-like DNA-binding protein